MRRRPARRELQQAGQPDAATKLGVQLVGRQRVTQVTEVGRPLGLYGAPTDDQSFPVGARVGERRGIPIALAQAESNRPNASRHDLGRCARVRSRAVASPTLTDTPTAGATSTADSASPTSTLAPAAHPD